MTLSAKHFDFLLKGSMRLLTTEQLVIPNTPLEHANSPAQDIVPGDQFAIFAEGDRSTYGIFTAQAWTNGSPQTPRRLTLLDSHYQSPLWLSPWQIDWLCSHGRLRPVHQERRDHKKTILPGSSLSLTPSQLFKAHQLLDYIDHYIRLCRDENKGVASVRLLDRAREEVSKRRGERPVGKTALYEALSKLKDRRNMDRVLAVAPLPSNGNALERFNPRLEEAMQSAVKTAWKDPRGSWLTVKAALEALCSQEGEYPDQEELAKKVSKSTLQRRFANVDLWTRTFLRYSEEEANRLSMQAARLARPDHPLDVVDIDHTELNVVVYDDLVPVAFGKPDILVFRDRHSAAVIGFHIGFEAPSFAGFVAGLKHSVYPKDPRSLPGGMTFPWYGMPTRLGVDQASHFTGGSMENAERELGFQVIEYRPGRPWEKGAMEHLFSILGMQLTDRLLGTTTRSPTERKKFDKEDDIAKPVLSIRELYGFLLYYFGEVYNRSEHAGLGPLVTLSDTPARLWENGIPHATMRPVVDPAVFTRLVGIPEQVTVQPDGIRIDYLHYQSAELVALRTHPKHKMGTRAHGATKYTATRDPNDLGRIWVTDPYRKVMIEVPVQDIEKRYATGLTLFQHRQIIKYHLEQKKTQPNVENLTEARRRLELQLAEMHAKRKKHGTAKKLARFVSGQAAKLRSAEIIELTANPAVDGWMNPAKPMPQTPESKVSPKTQGLLPGDGPTAPEPMVTDPDDTVEGAADIATLDIEELKARHSDWEE
ncbi:Mu transposase C-terminal domain-containing protein [Rhizobium ruizarguesonis]|jgi:putative transposase|uniref:Mu transposase C-terminal domain-containing protein n=1 Tax=Rhizobium ruizarguesonis TaxID=2081791 RepID=UPI0013DF7FC4|nr:Mu transposase C-terminal domain-containing protein [Rhizobium ruizarguesonis]NEJ95350.1 DDE-type integrase/transposase/recombinase [Rhizobium ruizarguesonis]